MLEEVRTLIRRACYIGAGAVLFIIASLLGLLCNWEYVTNPAYYGVMTVICFAIPPIVWPEIQKLCYIAFADIDGKKTQDVEVDEYLDGHSTFKSKELDALKKKYDSKESRKRKEDSFYNMTI